MDQEIDYNRKGGLLEELARIDDPLERKSRLFEVIKDIEGILAIHYADGQKGVEKLEHRLALRTSFSKEELEIFSRGVQEPLKLGLDGLEGYDRDTVNQVFIALYGHLVNEVKTRLLDNIVDHSRYDDTNAELADLMDQINIYHVYSTWVNENKRVVEGSNQSDMERASKQFRDLKKSAVGFMGAFKSLLWQDNNIVSAYALFNGSRTLENYDSAREVIEETISDCEEIVSQSNSNIKGNGGGTITKFARDIQLNAEYYFLKMGYDMLHDGDARKKLHDPEQFEQDLMTKARKMIYFPVTKLHDVPSVIQLSDEERAFYEVELKPKPL